MKKKLSRLVLVLATVMFVFTGCSLDDEYDEDMIVGSWTCTDGWDYVFEENHTGSRTQSGRTQPITSWSLDGDELEMKFDKYADGTEAIVTFRVYIIDDLTETRMEVYDKEDKKNEYVFTKKK